MSEVNSEFISMYIDKLTNSISELQKKYMILETQFEYNSKASEENLRELEVLKTSKGNLQLLQQASESNASKIESLSQTVDIVSQDRDNMRVNYESKCHALHEVNRQLEEVKDLLVAERNKVIALEEKNSNDTEVLKTIKTPGKRKPYV